MSDKLFTSNANQVGIEVKVESVANSGCTLARFADKTDEYGAKVEKILTENNLML